MLMEHYNSLATNSTVPLRLINHMSDYLNAITSTNLKQTIENFVVDNIPRIGEDFTPTHLMTILIWRFKYNVTDDNKLYYHLTHITPFEPRVNQTFNNYVASLTVNQLEMLRLINPNPLISMSRLTDLRSLSRVYRSSKLIYHFSGTAKACSASNIGMRLIYKYKHGNDYMEKLHNPERPYDLYTCFMSDRNPELDTVIGEEIVSFQQQFHSIRYTRKMLLIIRTFYYSLYEIFSSKFGRKLTASDLQVVMKRHQPLLAQLLTISKENIAVVTNFNTLLLLDYDSAQAYLNMGLSGKQLNDTIRYEIAILEDLVRHYVLTDTMWFMSTLQTLELINFATLGMSEKELEDLLKIEDIDYSKLNNSSY